MKRGDSFLLNNISLDIFIYIGTGSKELQNRLLDHGDVLMVTTESGNETARKQVLYFLPPVIRHILGRSRMPWNTLEEIRLRLNRPLAVHGHDETHFLNEQGASVCGNLAYRPDEKVIERALQLVSNSSLYAFEQELRCGYITVPGGHRVGLSGQAVLESGRVARLKHITGLNYRIAREIAGVALPFVSYFIDYRLRRVRNSMIVSPPRGGKTTFLRDLTRRISDGVDELGFHGFKVGVVDERSEIAGSFQGMPQLQVGDSTDVLDACPKAEGMMMLLRSMGPQVIVTDEIGLIADIEAVEEIIHAGVSVITTAHGSSLAEIRGRQGLRRLLDQGAVERILFLGRSRGVGTVEQIIDPRNGKSYHGRGLTVWKEE